MRSTIRAGLFILPATAAALALGLSAMPSGPAHALGHESLRAAVGQALTAPVSSLVRASRTTAQPQMMVRSDMMGRMGEMPGPEGMMRGMMGMMNMMGRMGEMMGDEGMMEQMTDMMETCNRMMQAMLDEDERPDAQQREREEQQERPQQ